MFFPRKGYVKCVTYILLPVLKSPFDFQLKLLNALYSVLFAFICLECHHSANQCLCLMNEMSVEKSNRLDLCTNSTGLFYMSALQTEFSDTK